MTNQKKYYPAVDLLRVIAIFGIVGCHLALPNLTIGARLLNRYVDYNVGVFAAIAGFFFFKSSSTSALQYFKSRIHRILVPYMIWTIVYVGFSFCFHTLSKGCFDFSEFTFGKICEDVFLGGSSAHLWFVIALFYVSVLLYPIRTLNLGWFWLLISVAILFTCDAYRAWFMFYPVRLLGFFVLGGWLTRVDANQKLTKPFVFALMISFLIGVYGLGFLPQHLFISELLVALPLCVFSIKCSAPFLNSHQEQLRYLGGLTFVIYLSHLLFTILLREIVVRIFAMQTAWVYLLDQILAFTLSLIFAHILMRTGKRFAILTYIYGGHK